MTKVSRSALYYITSNYLSVFIGFVTSIIAVRYLNIDTFGVFSHLQNASVFLVPFVWFGTNSILIRIVTYRTKNLLFGFLFIAYLLSAAVFSILLAALPELYYGNGISHTYSLNIIALGLLSFAALVQNFFDTFFLAAEKAKLVSVLTIVYAIVSLLSVLVLIFGHNINLALFADAGLTALVLIVVGLVHIRQIRTSIKSFFKDLRSKSLRKQVVKDIKTEWLFFRFYGLSNISNVVMKRIVNIYFANKGEASYLGILAIYNQFVDILLNLGWSINNSWGLNRLKNLIQKCKDNINNYPKLIGDYFREASIVNYLLITVFLLTSPIWINLLSFLLARWHVSYGLFSLILFFVALRYAIDYLSRILLYNPLYITEKLGVQMLIGTVMDVALIPVNYFLVVRFSLYGALLTTLLPGLVTYLSGELFVKEYRLFRLRLMFVSIVSFAPITFMHWPGSIGFSALLALVFSVSVSGIFYLLHGKQYRSEITAIMSSIELLNKPLERIVLLRQRLSRKEKV